MTDEGSAVIGAGPDCDLKLSADPYVSTRHALLSRHHDHVWIEDLGSIGRTVLTFGPNGHVTIEPAP